MKTSYQNQVKQVNEYYSNNMNEDDAIESLIYLTNKSRGKYLTEKQLRSAYRTGELGEILKRYDSIAFQLFFE